MAGLDANTKLLLHCNGTDGSTTFTDESDNNHTMTAIGTAQIDTAESKFGGASGFFDGNSDYLTSPDSSSWDLVASNSDDWTIDFWVKYNDYTTEGGYLVSQWVDDTHRWFFSYSAGAGFGFHVNNVASGVINIAKSNPVSDNNWHHLALIKVADKYGIYKDGVQIGYTQDSTTVNFTGSLGVGARADGASKVNGHMDEVRIQKSNYFTALPNVGLTNTITVPTSEYGVASLATPRSQAIIIT